MCPGGKGEVRGGFQLPVPERRWAHTRSEQHGTEGQKSIIQRSNGDGEMGHFGARAEHRAQRNLKRGSFIMLLHYIT